MSDLAKLLGPLARRIGNLLARGTVATADAAKKMQALQVRLLAGESKDAIEHVEPYGFTSCPHPGAEVVAAFFDGDRSHGVVLVAADRRYRKTGLQPGEVALYTDEGDSIVFKRGRLIEVVAGAKLKVTAPEVEVIASTKVTVTTPLVEVIASTKVTLTTPLVEMSGALQVAGNITGGANITASGNIADQGGAKTMAGMRTTYNGHTHVENALPGSTNTPTQAM